jgi:beta-mannosidase
MGTIALNGTWKLHYALERKDAPASIEEVRRLGWPNIAAEVPGNVELDLCRAGVEEDPFFAENLYRFRKYEFHQWWFEREFIVPEGFPEEEAVLRISGLDTFGTVWVNGAFVGETDDMMLEYEFDVTEHLHPGANAIVVRIRSSVNQARDCEYPVSVKGAGWEHIDEMVRIRKPAHSFGWDIAPRLLSAGLWRDIGIVSRSRTRLKDVYYGVRKLERDHVDLVVRFRYTTDEPMLEGFSVRVRGRCGDSAFDHAVPTQFCSDEVYLTLPEPRLWWPAGYGAPDLYDVVFELLFEGRVVDERRERIGIRTIEFDTNFAPGEGGRFKILVNDTPILCKGTNWVPLDALHSRDKDRLQRAHDLLVEVGCNMVRCWGGNVYEDTSFFDLCDERGILVWQDFSLACGIYPQDDGFLKQIETEATAIVRKLRNHASLALWCGDNEVDMMYYFFDVRHAHARYNRITRELLPRVAGSHDPFRYFLPSSPYLTEPVTTDLGGPEQHNWGPRDSFKGAYYQHTTAHFISEIGYHGCPAISSIRKFISPEFVWPYRNDEWATHNTQYIRLSRDRGYDRNELMADQIGNLFGFDADTLEDFASSSQICQAEAKKFFVEMVRLKKWRRTGVIWWNLLDCWPQFSDAVVDYYFSRKLAYFYIQRSQQPICLMVDEAENWHHAVVLGNDSRTDAEVRFTVEDGDTGEVLLSGRTRSPANENLVVGSVKAYAGKQRLLLLRWEIDGDGKPHANHYVSGHPPLDRARYAGWLKRIEALPEAFDSETCWKGTD